MRDLFQTARKQAPAIIFVDEIDSIGRKRGAGLGGGHDEREQTLNQMLSEMDGFEATEGIVMMAATNRPDILDPALLRPGRFDRQIVVPLPDAGRAQRHPRGALPRQEDQPPTSTSTCVARGTPGMSGADLANLVNEAALFAVRRGAHEVHKEDFDDRPRPRAHGPASASRWRSSEDEKEVVAYHEAGHAVCAYVLEHADPVHKVTILPTGMALGVTQQLPLEERHIYKREYIDDSLVVRLGGRVAEELVFGASVHRRRTTTSSAPPSSPARWCASGACPIASARWRGARRARCSSARTSCTRATTPTRPPGSSTKRSSASCARRRTAAARRLSEHRAGLDVVAQGAARARDDRRRGGLDLVDTAMGRKVGGPRKIIHADGTEEYATEAIEDGLEDLG